MKIVSLFCCYRICYKVETDIQLIIYELVVGSLTVCVQSVGNNLMFFVDTVSQLTKDINPFAMVFDVLQETRLSDFVFFVNALFNLSIFSSLGGINSLECDNYFRKQNPDKMLCKMSIINLQQEIQHLLNNIGLNVSWFYHINVQRESLTQNKNGIKRVIVV